MKDETRELAAEYAVIVNKYCLAFAKKHGLGYNTNNWVGGNVGGTIEICDLYINFDDIRHDIDKDIDEGEFLAWYDYVELLGTIPGAKTVNYPSWCMGCRPYTDEHIAEMLEAQKKVIAAKENLKNLCGVSITCCGNCPMGEVQTDGNYVRCRHDGTFHKCNDRACDFA